MAAAFGWKTAWDKIEDDPHFEGMEYYPLESESYDVPGRIYEGDQFWMTDEHHLIEVDSVKTKVYRGVVGPKGEEGNDNVFFTPDWTPPKDPHRKSHWTDDVNFMPVEEFIARLEGGELVPHRGNGLPRRPPY